MPEGTVSIPIDAATAGDAVFCHGKGFVSHAIRAVTDSNYNHVAWLDHQDDQGNWIVGQAGGKGVTITSPLDTTAPGGSHTIVPVPAGVDRAKMLAFLRAQDGIKYGFLTDASILLNRIVPRINVMVSGTWICSAVYAEGLRAGGWLHNWPDLYQVSPQDIWAVIG